MYLVIPKLLVKFNFFLTFISPGKSLEIVILITLELWLLFMSTYFSDFFV